MDKLCGMEFRKFSEFTKIETYLTSAIVTGDSFWTTLLREDTLDPLYNSVARHVSLGVVYERETSRQMPTLSIAVSGGLPSANRL